MRAKNIKDLFIFPDQSIDDAIRNIDQNADGISLVVDQNHKLIGTITDGDIRRAIIAGIELSTPINELLAIKNNSIYPEPIFASEDDSPDTLLRIMQEWSIQQVPIVNSDGRVENLITLKELIPQDDVPIKAVIMAGGLGTRLRPLTNSTPKPLLPVGDRPLMELIIGQLKRTGVDQVSISTNYQSEKIMEYFGDGSDLGIEINYITEDQPLGTAGALGLISNPEQPLLVINGDILTKLDFQAMHSFHTKNFADMTVAVRRLDIVVPFGVLECDDYIVRGVKEKPSINFLVNAGIYLVGPSVFNFIPPEKKFDMTDLIEVLINHQRKVISFPVVEYWLDIGQLSDYQQAQDDLENGRFNS